MTGSAWLPIFRAIAADIGDAIRPLAGSPEGRKVVGAGAGGDPTVHLDAVAEGIALRHLEKARQDGRHFRLISEELGSRDFGGSELILLDPVDGSYNAKQGLPYFAVVLAVSGSDRLADVTLGYVRNLVTGDEFYAERGGGAFRNDRALHVEPVAFDGRSFPLIQFDSPSGVDVRERARALVGRAEKVRQLGSAALNLCHTATGGISLQVTPFPVRAFDLAGPLLILAESGGVATDFSGRPLSDVRCDLEARTTLLASSSAAVHRHALQVLGFIR